MTHRGFNSKCWETAHVRFEHAHFARRSDGTLNGDSNIYFSYMVVS